MRQVDWAAVDHLLSSFSSPFFVEKLLYDYGLMGTYLINRGSKKPRDSKTRALALRDQNFKNGRHQTRFPEPVFVNVSGAQESIPPAFVAWQAGTTNRVV